MYDKKKISVVIPVYNVEKYLSECLDSVLHQTMKEIEVICVDDGSTDRSLEILQKYALNDNRVHVLQQKNRYAGAARNAGMEIAEGEYLIFLDSDDFFHPALLERAYLRGKQQDADVVLFSGMRYHDATGEYMDASWYLKEKLLPGKDVFSRKDCDGRLLEITTPSPWTKMFRRDFIQKSGLKFQIQQNANDAYFVLTAISMAEKITYIRDRLVYYRIGLENSVQKTKVHYPCCFLDAYEAVFCKTKELGIYEQIERGFVNTVLSGCIFNLRTMKDLKAREQIRKRMQETSFREMGLFRYYDAYYTNKKK